MKDVTNVKIQSEDIPYMDTKAVHVTWTQGNPGGLELASGYNLHIPNSMLYEVFLSADPDKLYDLLMQMFKPVFALGSIAITTAVRNFIDDQVATFSMSPKFTVSNMPKSHVTLIPIKNPDDDMVAQETFSATSWQLPAMQKNVKNPATGEMRSLRTVIIDLNDRWGWTRERIADWLETLDVDIRFRKDGNEST
jgi:hypothetical protein